MRICQDAADLPSGPDVTAQLNALIAGYPDGTAFHFGDERYRVDGTVTIDQRNGLTFEGGTFFTDIDGPLNPQGRSNRCVFNVMRSNDLTFRGVRVEGNAPDNPTYPTLISLYRVAYEAEHGFQFDGCSRVLLEDVSTYRTSGDGINIRGGGGQGFVGRCSDIEIVRPVIERNGRQGLTITASNDIVVQGATIMTPARSAVDLEPNSAAGWVEGVELADCNLFSAFFRPIACLGKARVDNIHVHGCSLGSKGGAIRVDVGASDGTLRTGWTLEDCTDTPSNNAPRLAFTKVQGVAVRRCDWSMTGAYSGEKYAMRLTDCPEPLEFTDNLLHGFTGTVEKRGTTGTVTESGNQLLPKV